VKGRNTGMRREDREQAGEGRGRERGGEGNGEDPPYVSLNFP